MSFRNQLVTALRIVTPAGLTALLIRGGPNSNGQGQAVIQLSTGSADEQNPAELTAISDGNLPASKASLFIESPSKVSQGGNGRAFLQLFARDSGGNSYGILGGDFMQLQGDTLFLLGQNHPTTEVRLNGSLSGFASGSAPTLNGILLAGPIDGTAGKPAAFARPPDLHPQAVTPALTASLAVRSGYNFTVSALGAGHCLLEGQLQNIGTTALGSGTIAVPVGGLPTWARPSVTQSLAMLGSTAAPAGVTPASEVRSDGSVHLYNCSIPANAFITLTGVYPL